jgi:hypothetical protein
MSIRITIDIFSGRPNPFFELSGKEAKEALERLRPARPLSKSETFPLIESTLGYRGLVVEQIGAPLRGLPKLFASSMGVSRASVLHIAQPIRTLKSSSSSASDVTFGGVVTLRHGENSESRADPFKKFERLLLASGPEGVLPPGWNGRD